MFAQKKPVSANLFLAARVEYIHLVRNTFRDRIKAANPEKKLIPVIQEEKLHTLAGKMDEFRGASLTEMSQALKAFNDYKVLYFDKIKNQIESHGLDHEQKGKLMELLDDYGRQVKRISDGFMRECEVKRMEERKEKESREKEKAGKEEKAPGRVDAPAQGHNLSKVKATLERWNLMAESYLATMGMQKDKVAEAARQIEQIPRWAMTKGASDLQKMTLRVRGSLGGAVEEGRRIVEASFGLLQEASEDGLASLLRVSGVNPSLLDTESRKQFHKMQQLASTKLKEAIDTFHRDIAGASEKLLPRLSELESGIKTPSPVGGLKAFCVRMASDLELLKKSAERNIEEFKSWRKGRLLGNFDLESGEKFKDFADHPEALDREIGEARQKLEEITEARRTFSAQAKRALESVPQEFRHDAEVAKMMIVLESLASRHDEAAVKEDSDVEQYMQSLRKWREGREAHLASGAQKEAEKAKRHSV